MVTNIYIRVFLGIWSILIGVVLGKMYLDRDKDSFFGMFYRNVYTEKWEKSLRSTGINPRVVCIILSLLPIVTGVIVLLFGVRKTLVGGP